VRVRQAGDRAMSQLGELALLNESLMGQETWKIRKKVEYLKSKRKAWEGVYNAACKQEVSLTVAHLEEAIAEVRCAHVAERMCKV
jgi:chlorophyllide a oxygenase